MKLSVRTQSAELFFRNLHEAGNVCYRVEKADIVEGVYDIEAVYHSSNKDIYFRGRLNAKQFEILRAQALPVKIIAFDHVKDVITVDDLEE